jgi:hypothetical protein
MARSRLKALGLCALVLGLMAFASSAAQAETGAHWNIIKANSELVQVNETNKLFAQVEIREIENNTATLLFTTKAGTKVGILCTTAKFDEGGLLQASGGVSLGRMLFTGCIVFLNGVRVEACEAHTTGKAKGEILTLKIKGLIVLDVVGGVTQDYVKFTPDEGNAFAHIELGVECAIGELVLVEAKSAGEGFWIKDCGKVSGTGACEESNKSFLEEKPEHLITESLHGLIALGQPATIDGSAFVRLSGEHALLQWGGTPG